MTGTDWNWDEQRADTVWTVEHLNTEKDVPIGAAIVLEIQTVAAPESGPLARAAYLSALADAGLPARAYTDDDGIETIEVAIEDARFDAEDIWTHEKRVTEIALARGWQPDGWGFWEPD